MSDTDQPELEAVDDANGGTADGDGDGKPTFLVVRQDAEAAPVEEVDHPSKLLRIATMVQSLLNQVKTTDLDEAGRERLAEVHNRALAALNEVISEDLREEMHEVALAVFDEERTPTASELRIAQAQLVGWLEGLFRGIQASMASQQMMAQAQLEKMRQAPGPEHGGTGPAGQYL